MGAVPSQSHQISLALWGKGRSFHLSFLFEGSQASKKRASPDWPIATPFLDLRVRTENRKVAEYCQSERTRAGRQWTATNRRGRPERASSVGGWSWKHRFSALGRHFVLVIAADRELVAVSFQGRAALLALLSSSSPAFLPPDSDLVVTRTGSS